MARGNMPPEEEAQIKAKLPSIDGGIADYLDSIPLDLVALTTGVNPGIYIAIICLQEAKRATEEAIYALEEAYSNLIWHRKYHPKAPVEYWACYFGRFYADDAALRLYAAAEHAANQLHAEGYECILVWQVRTRPPSG